jgi:hypothetical protein
MSTINGQQYQHANLNFQVSGTGAPYVFAMFKSVNYKIGAKKEAVRDYQGQIVGYTIKESEAEFSVTMLLSEWFKFRDWLRLQAVAISAQLQKPIGIGQVAFDATCQYGPTLLTRKLDRLVGCMVNEEARKSSDDQNALEVEVPFFVMDIVDNNGNRFVVYDQ